MFPFFSNESSGVCHIKTTHVMLIKFTGNEHWHTINSNNQFHENRRNISFWFLSLKKNPPLFLSKGVYEWRTNYGRSVFLPHRPRKWVCMFEKKKKKQGQPEDLIAATGLVILLKLDSNRWFFFWPVWPWNLMDDLKNKRVPLLCYFQVLCIIS